MSRDLLEKIENRRVRIRRTIEGLREEITRLGEHLAAAEHALERLEITHQTVVELTTEDTPNRPNPSPTAIGRSSPCSPRTGKGYAPRTPAGRWVSAPNPATSRACGRN
ncbi:hypothetical protein [Frankia gtarii]|uniref:hypothetical protein n=1 Tax=Frankia gtarii TaxID=2950102 RepID=UPI0021C04324|nr:hypothetical protein [Frankia gtarii]